MASSDSAMAPCDPLVSLLCSSLNSSVISVMAGEKEKTFLVQMAIKERLTSHGASLLILSNTSQCLLWKKFLSMSTNMPIRCLGEIQEDETKIEEAAVDTEEEATDGISDGELIISTPSNLSKMLRSNSAAAAVSLVIVDNGQLYLSSADGEAMAMAEVMSWLREEGSNRKCRFMTLTSNFLTGMPERLDRIDLVFESLAGTYPGSVETSCDLVAALRQQQLSPPNLTVVQYRRQFSEEADFEPAARLEATIHRLVEDCKKFLETHRYSLFETYGDFEDLIKDIPDPILLPLAILDEFLVVLTDYGVWAADRAALLLYVKVDRLRTREKYERHFLLLGVVYTFLANVRKLCDDAFAQIGLKTEDQGGGEEPVGGDEDDPKADYERMVRFSKPKLLKLVGIIREYKSEPRGKPRKNAAEKNDAAAENVAAGNEGDKPTAAVEENAADPDSQAEKAAVENEEGPGNDPVKKEESQSGSLQKAAATQPVRRFRLRRRGGGLHSGYDDPNALCCLVFVNSDVKAKVLFHFFKDLSRTNEAFSGVRPQYYDGKRVAESDAADAAVGDNSKKRKKDDALRKFRTRDSNLLVTSSCLETGVEGVRCSLSVDLDPPADFYEYAYHKVKGRISSGGRASKHLIFCPEGEARPLIEQLAFYRVVERRLSKASTGCNDEGLASNDSSSRSKEVPRSKRNVASLATAVSLVNRYCSKLPSDTFTRLTAISACREITVSSSDADSDSKLYVSAIQLPVNSPLRRTVFGRPMPTPGLANQSAALEVCKELHGIGELDDNMYPTGKVVVATGGGGAVQQSDGNHQLGSTKRRQYYYKLTAPELTTAVKEEKAEEPASHVQYRLYALSLRLVCPIPDDQNTRGRKIFHPEEARQSFGFLTTTRLPELCPFPIYTRSGEVIVEVVTLLDNVTLSEEERALVLCFHDYTFSKVLRLEKFPMVFSPEKSENSVFCLPLTRTKDGEKCIDWTFLRRIRDESESPALKPVSDSDRECFEFDEEEYADAVVMPWYRNQDQPQYFYVAEICRHLSPRSDFPGQGFDTFGKYYSSKYGIQIQNSEQPLLDVDHTSARLNFLTPRYVNRKGVALPTSSEETKKSKRECLDQKQILVPELCSVHPFRASLWRQAVSLPCVFYRLNGLLVADGLRRRIAAEAAFGVPDLSDGARWGTLTFGWTLADVLRKREESPAAGKKDGAKVKRNKMREGSAAPASATTEGGADEEKEALGDLDLLSDRLVNEINEENKKLKKQSMDIGMWSNEMASVDTAEKRGASSSDKDPDSDLSDSEDLLSALPENLTLISNNDNRSILKGSPSSAQSQKKKGGDRSSSKDWVSGIEQKRFRVGSPTFFSNPNINIPGISGDVFDDLDGLSCSDDDDEEGEYFDFDSGGSEKMDFPVMRSSGGGGGGGGRSTTKADAEEMTEDGVRIEFRGNQAEAFEDSEEERRRVEKLAREREEERTMVRDFPWGDAVGEGADNVVFVSAVEQSVKQMSDDPSLIMDSGAAFKLQSDASSASSPREGSPPANEDGKEDQVNSEALERAKAELAAALTMGVALSHQDEGELPPKKQEDVVKSVTSKRNESSPSFSFDEQPDLERHPGPSPSLILQSLTMSNSNDAINLERLETIGDSFLKYAITAFLFCAHDHRVHEGRLSHLRSKQVSNVHLYQLGRAKRLGEMMVASKFEPHDNWLPPCFRVPAELEQALIESGVPATHWNMAEMTLLGDGGVDKEAICKMVKEKSAAAAAAAMKSNESGLSETSMTKKSADVVDMPTFVPYNLLTQHSIPDKSIADCVEALIGAYLIACGPRGALLFMSWLGLQVLPEEESVDGSKKPGYLKQPSSPLLADSAVIANPEPILCRHLRGYDSFEDALGYRFRDRSYLLQAFTHASFHLNRLTDCYQRLEFLGDAVLDYLVTRYLYEDPRKHSPGALTDLRSALVNNTIFASLAVKHDYHKYFRHFSPGLQSVIDRFVKMQVENGHKIAQSDGTGYDFLLGEEESEDAEEVEVPKALGDIFESVAGAIYLDSGLSLDAVWSVYHPMMREEIETFSRSVPKSPIRELLELEPETAKFCRPERLADGRRVRVTVEVFGKGVFKGIGRNYRIAKCTAANCALRAIKRLNKTTVAA